MFLVIIGIIELVLLSFMYRKQIKLSKSIILVFIFSILINYFVICNNIFFEEIDSLLEKYVIVLISVVIAILYDSIFINFFQRFQERKFIKNYENKFKVKNYQYYRELLYDIPPTIIAYCYNKKINFKDVVIAVILRLNLKKYINIKNNEIELLVDKSYLMDHEIFVVEKINNLNKKKIKDKFKKILSNDLFKEKYIYDKNEKVDDFAFIMVFIIVYFIIYMIITVPFFMYYGFVFEFLFIYSALFFLFGIIGYIYSKMDVTVRTKKSLELASKITGLKNFFEDFSNINDKQIKDISLYDEYIIYAIILNLKGKLDGECKRIYNNLENMIIKDKSKFM